MPKDSRKNDQPEFFIEVDDELLDELGNITGQPIVHFSIWEESLADALETPQAEQVDPVAFDIDLYLEGGVYFECYSTLCFADPESDPLNGLPRITAQMDTLLRDGVWLDDVAVDEENQLVLILAQQRQPVFYLVVSGWALNEWEELPE